MSKAKLPKFNQDEVAAMVGLSQQWVSNTLPASMNRGGGYSPAAVLQWVVKDLKRKHTVKLASLKKRYAKVDERDEISRRKKLAEAQNAEDLLELNRLKISRLRGELMAVDRVHQIVDMAAAELRKPIEIIGRNHPELQQLILNGLDNARDKLTLLFKDDRIDE